MACKLQSFKPKFSIIGVPKRDEMHWTLRSYWKRTGKQKHL